MANQVNERTYCERTACGEAGGSATGHRRLVLSAFGNKEGWGMKVVPVTDLRLGNHIQMSDNDKNLGKYWNEVVTTQVLIDIKSSHYSANGIPLTPEILEKSGAVNKYRCVYFIGKLKLTMRLMNLANLLGFTTRAR